MVDDIMSSDNLVTRVQRFVEEKNMLAQGDHVLAGISGGADSMCLLLLLTMLRDTYGLQLSVIHIHHGIRGNAADHDANYVREWCEKNSIYVEVRKFDVPHLAKEQGISLEEAGRNCRYACFDEEATKLGATKVAVAHHIDDQAETLLFRMARGTGIRGLSGMSAVSTPFDNQSLKLIRPLLTITRKEIEEFLEENAIEYCTDATNDCNDYGRNRIRNLMLPELTQVNQQASRHLAWLAEQAGDWNEWANQEVERLYQSVASERGLYIQPLLTCPKALRREVLLTYIRRLANAEKDITFSHVLQLEGLLQAQSGKECWLPYGVVIEKCYDYLVRKQSCNSGKCEVPIKAFPFELSMVGTGIVRIMEKEWNKSEKQIKIPKNKCTKWFDYDKIGQELCIRTRLPGDYLVIGTNCGNQTLQDYFVDAKIPREMRDTIPLLAAGALVLWVIGYRTSENCRVDENTTKILTVDLEEY